MTSVTGLTAAMTNSRTKGRSGEYEIRDILFDQLGLTFKRDIEQFRQADRGDLLCVDMDFPAVIEVKRYAKGGETPRGAWWDQVCKAADGKGIPLLIYRFDRQPIRMVFPLHVVGDYPENNQMTCTVGVEEGSMLIREVMNASSGVQAQGSKSSKESFLG